MTAFVAVASRERGIPDLPAACVAALRVVGAAAPTLHATAGFSCAAAGSRGETAALVADSSMVLCGDVRLDDRGALTAALDVAAPGGAHAWSSPSANVRPALSLVASAHLRWGHQAPARLRGDYSYAYWDASGTELVAARDGLGVRPLYYAEAGGAVVVSNVLDAVRAYPHVSSALHEPAVVSFLRIGWNADPSGTTFAGIKRLAPGSTLIVGREGALRVVCHWTMPDPAPLELRDDAEYVDRYRALLRAAVADRVEPGHTVLFLSGGIDSPTIAAAAVEAGLASGISALTTRTTDVESPEESRLAAEVAARLGLRHRLAEFVVDPRPEAPRVTPEPYDDPEYAATTAFLREIGRSASVVIEGEDGDALFSPPGLAAMLRREPAFALLARMTAYTLRHGHHPYLGLWLRRRLRPWRDRAAESPDWLTARAGCVAGPPKMPGVTNTARPEAAASLGDPIWQSVHDGGTWPYHGAPIEYRWPLLDTRLLEFVFSVPAVPWCQRKRLARRAYARDLPEAVTRRRKTTVPGYHERLVAVWRARTQARISTLSSMTREYVDPARLAGTLATGETEAVLGAWRAVQFDQWVRTAGVG